MLQECYDYKLHNNIEKLSNYLLLNHENLANTFIFIKNKITLSTPLLKD